MAPTLLQSQSLPHSQIELHPTPVISQLLADLSAEVRKCGPNSISGSLDPQNVERKEQLQESLPPLHKANATSTLLKLGRLLNSLWETTPKSPLWSEIWDVYGQLKSDFADGGQYSPAYKVEPCVVIEKQLSLLQPNLTRELPSSGGDRNLQTQQTRSLLQSVRPPVAGWDCQTAPTRPDVHARISPASPMATVTPQLEVYIRSVSFSSLRLHLCLTDTIATVQRHVSERLGLLPQVFLALIIYRDCGVYPRLNLSFVLFTYFHFLDLLRSFRAVVLQV